MGKKSTRKKVTKRSQKHSNKVRDMEILADSIGGKTQAEIAKKHNLTRERVSRILNSDDVKKIAKKAEADIYRLVDSSVQVIREALELRGNDFHFALTAAIKVLKSTGAMREKVDINHNIDKPFIIERLDGGQIQMGMKKDEDG